MDIQHIIRIFNHSIADYHITDKVDTRIQNRYEADSLDAVLYQKNWIDTVQWHLEDIIRDPQIKLAYALQIKRRIDEHNQIRTNLVEQIDVYFFTKFSKIALQQNAKNSTETLGWAIDRLSILCLKIYHMHLETLRKDIDDLHIQNCKQRLFVLQQQQQDLSLAITQLYEAIAKGDIKCLQYKQMKMYNDPTTNPILYNKKH